MNGLNLNNCKYNVLSRGSKYYQSYGSMYELNKEIFAGDLDVAKIKFVRKKTEIIVDYNSGDIKVNGNRILSKELLKKYRQLKKKPSLFEKHSLTFSGDGQERSYISIVGWIGANVTESISFVVSVDKEGKWELLEKREDLLS